MFGHELQRLLGVQDGVVSAGDDGQPGLYGGLTGGDLVAHLGHHGGPGSDEPDPGLHAGISEVAPLGEEAVAGVDGVDVVLLGDTDDVRDVQVGRHRRATATNQVGLVCLHSLEDNIRNYL